MSPGARAVPGGMQAPRTPAVGDRVNLLYGSEVFYPSLEAYASGDGSTLVSRGDPMELLEIAEGRTPEGKAALVSTSSGPLWTFLSNLVPVPAPPRGPTFVTLSKEGLSGTSQAAFNVFTPDGREDRAVVLRVDGGAHVSLPRFMRQAYLSEGHVDGEPTAFLLENERGSHSYLALPSGRDGLARLARRAARGLDEASAARVAAAVARALEP